MNKKISIIVPVFNAEKTIARCVDSLIKQSYSNIEIILIDDDSKDNSLSICKRYEQKDVRIKVIHKSNGGVSSARNAGLDKASGEFIMFCDSDDWVDTKWCEELLSAYQSDDFIMCGQYIEGVQEFFPYEVFVKGAFERREFLQLKMKMFNVPWNKLFNRTIIEENCLRYDTRLTNGEDLLFNILYMSHIAGKIVCIDKCLYHYVWPNSGSLSKYIPEDYLEQRNYYMKQMEKAIKKIGGVSKEEWLLLYKDLFNEYVKILHTLLLDRNKPLNLRMRKGNKIMKSDEYKKCVKEISGRQEYRKLWLYRGNNCYSLFLLYKIEMIMKRI